ncbi:DUF1573 domain-containing protein [Ferruginibacter lapsinanis]|uniref:DUF1573 domain-containing protein n=1 Tax=Ferruginibacter lapsinanis TaxID=563172 RepID=UPI001E48BFAD|nr:DUF1573 domain-containing protein [Ferruginibacter lapsinanis]UEG48803.1 DUF1573 domain-containing protein [Ferruginibacter lapsinanis]
MNRSIFVIALLSVIVSCDVKRNDKISDDAAMQEKAALKDTTSVQLIDSVFNFGTVTEGEKVEFNFRFKNTGTKPMVITSTSASCGCTVAEKPEKPILPGEISFIKAVFNSQGKTGHNEKTITVTANTNPDFPTLLLKGEVIVKK